MKREQLVGDRNIQQHGNLRFQRDISLAQQTIYEFLLEIVVIWDADAVLNEFKHLFIHHNNTISSHTLPSLYEIVISNQEQEFRNTLKRSCYILINNWDISRNHKPIRQLIQLFDDPLIHKAAISPSLKRLRTWLQNFIQSQDFQELRLFATRYDEHHKTHWTERYASYLLVPQYINLDNPIEQRRVAKALSHKLKEKFKFDLAIYTAHSQSAMSKQRAYQNPTGLGDEVLRLIKMIVAKRGVFSYANLANIFLKQTQHLDYQDFKKSLIDYLVFSVSHDEFTRTLKEQLTKKLDSLYSEQNDQPITDALLLRTCNRVIQYLTTENRQEPSPLFILLVTKCGPLIPVIVLLKLILICRHTRTQLEARIADLIRYYELCREEDCKWMINFLEIFNVTMAIYTENIEYSLVQMHPQGSDYAKVNLKTHLDAYRIFSQMRKTMHSEHELEQLEMKAIEVLSEELEKA